MSLLERTRRKAQLTARVNDNTGDGGTVTADPLGGRVDDNVGTVVDGTDKVSAGAKGVVNDKGNAAVVGDLGDRLEIGHVVARVTDRLDVDGLGACVDGLGKVLGLVSVDELGLDAEAGEENLELVVCATVEVGGGDDVVAGAGEREESESLGRLAGRGGDGGNTTLESGDTLLKDIVGRVHQTRVAGRYEENQEIVSTRARQEENAGKRK